MILLLHKALYTRLNFKLNPSVKLKELRRIKRSDVVMWRLERYCNSSYNSSVVCSLWHDNTQMHTKHTKYISQWKYVKRHTENEWSYKPYNSFLQDIAEIENFKKFRGFKHVPHYFAVEQLARWASPSRTALPPGRNSAPTARWRRTWSPYRPRCPSIP